MILAIIQARMFSTRLPGKVLMPIAGKPILQWVIEAAQGAELVDGVVAATSIEDSDEPIWRFCYDQNVDVRAGNLDDVLDRYYRTAIYYKPNHVVRLTADCPMLDPGVIDRTIRCHLLGNYDYTHNVNFADGFDVEVFTMNTLTRAAKLAKDEYDREHVTPFMRNKLYFNVGEYRRLGERPTIKFSVDTQEDYERVKGEMECLLNQKGCSLAP